MLVTYAWDALSRRSSTTPLTRGNGTTTSYGYDTASSLTTLGHDVAGTSLDATVTFGYTLASQLNSRSTTNNALGWWTAPSKTQAYVADGLNRYTSVNGTTYRYTDSRGNLTSDGSRTFAYDVENRLTSVSGYGEHDAGLRSARKTETDGRRREHDAISLRRRSPGWGI